MLLKRAWSHAVCVDPGPSTGIVLADWPSARPVDWSTVVWTAQTVAQDALRDWLTERASRFVRECALRHEPCFVLMERPPQRSRTPAGAAQIVQEWLRDWGCVTTALQVSPGQWKPWVRANPIPETATKLHTPHERDALSLLWYGIGTGKLV